jgi:Glycosyltransferase family 87
VSELKHILERAIPIAALVVLPFLVTIAALTLGSLAWDFHHELYPQAKVMLDGRNPYPKGDFEPLVGSNHVWPPAAAALVAPLTPLPAGAADVVMALVGLACMGLAVWLVGVHDWRIYGVLALWPPVFIEPRLSHLTPFVMLLAALAWRVQRSTYRSGVYVGAAVALKLFVWPLAVWLASQRKRRATLLALSIAGCSLLLVLPFTGLDDYVNALRRVSAAYDQDSYTVFGLIVQSGGTVALAHAITVAFTAALAIGTWRYRSFALAVATSLVASPIVWLDYFALAAIPLAVARPRLAPLWFVPLATVGAEGAGWQIGDAWDTSRVLGVFALVLAVAFRSEREAEAAKRLPRLRPAGDPMLASPTRRPAG